MVGVKINDQLKANKTYLLKTKTNNKIKLVFIIYIYIYNHYKNIMFQDLHILLTLFRKKNIPKLYLEII